ncbi:MAG: hypothetical protein H7A37_10205 [Chlamydiales bacterium]|nr:hypothetical protein [Chlamydiales bacterium]
MNNNNPVNNSNRQIDFSENSNPPPQSSPLQINRMSPEHRSLIQNRFSLIAGQGASRSYTPSQSLPSGIHILPPGPQSSIFNRNNSASGQNLANFRLAAPFAPQLFSNRIQSINLSTTNINFFKKIISDHTTGKINDNAVYQWIKEHISLFRKKDISKLDEAHQFQLMQTFLKIKPTAISLYYNIISELPRNMYKISEYLIFAVTPEKMESPDEIWKEIKLKFNENQRFLVLAHYISIKQVRIAELDLSVAELSTLLPHLRIGKFDDLTDEEVKIILDKATGLTELEINSDKVTKLTIASNIIKTIKVTLENCEEFDCSRCAALREVTVNLNKCKRFYCNDCSSLEHVITDPLLEREELALQSCEEFKCDDCTFLESLPTTLPNCCDFSSNDCEYLDVAPVLPLISNVNQNDCPYTLEEFCLEMSDIKEFPKEMLIQLDEKFLTELIFPTIHLIEDGILSATIDAGGVVREFVTKLFESLFSEDRSRNLLYLSEGVPEADDDEESVACFRAIGKIFAYCYFEYHDIKIGEIFSERFYRCLINMPNIAKDKRSDFDKIEDLQQYLDLPKDILQLLKGEKDISQLSHNITDYLTPFLDDDISNANDFFSIEVNRTKLLKAMVDHERNDPTMRALRKIAKEFRYQLDEIQQLEMDQPEMEEPGSVWKQLVGQGYDELIQRIQGQGALSKEKLLASIKWKNNSAFNEKEIKTQNYLINWINKAEERRLSQFVLFTTGSKTLGKIPIKVNICSTLSPIHLPNAHTCDFTIDLSSEYPDQETFNKKLERAIEEEAGCFGNV